MSSKKTTIFTHTNHVIRVKKISLQKQLKETFLLTYN